MHAVFVYIVWQCSTHIWMCFKWLLKWSKVYIFWKLIFQAAYHFCIFTASVNVWTFLQDETSFWIAIDGFLDLSSSQLWFRNKQCARFTNIWLSLQRRNRLLSWYLVNVFGLEALLKWRANCFGKDKICGHSYERSAFVNYDSIVVLTLKVPILLTALEL